MDGQSASQHPTDETLRAFGLGKLEQVLSDAVYQHLEACPECWRRVSEVSADPFLIRIRQAQKEGQAARSEESLPSYDVTMTKGKPPGPPPVDSLPPGFADHPDYEILRELGRGGMGVVYLAHNRLMGRDEVLKVMNQRLMDHGGALDRFLREIRAVAKFRHPNIVAAYSATRIGENLVFSMEYVEGLDLSKLVKTKGPLPVAHACHFAHQAALGLQHAHEAGLIHRDIKPANLMLTRDGKKATIKVLDFGLAKVTREAKLDKGLTLEGQALGTPDYNAPEQILDAQTVDIRADIYSLGCTLYYLLAGRPPFKAQSLYDIYQAHISRDAETLNFVRPEVPSELGALVAKMMAKDPAKRFQTPGEVAEALKPFFKAGAAGFQRPEMDVSVDTNRRGGFQSRPRERPEIPPYENTDLNRRDGFQTRLPERLASTDAQPGSKPAANEPRWETLVNFNEPEKAPEPVAQPEPSARPSWPWPLVAVGVLLMGLIIAYGVSLKVRTSEGDIVLKNVPDNAEVFVDGDKVTLIIDGKSTLIRVVPGKHKIEVKKDGFSTFTDERLSFKADGSDVITVELKRLPPPLPAPNDQEAPESAALAKEEESAPAIVEAAIPPAPGIAASDRRLWVADSGQRFDNYEKEKWRETTPDGYVFNWVERSRGDRFVEIFDGSRNGGAYVQLGETEAQILWYGRDKSFRHYSRGRWVAKPVALEGSRPGEERDDNGLKMKFCWCPPETFMMGSPLTEPRRRRDEDQVQVRLTQGFWMGKYELTQAQWTKIMGTEKGSAQFGKGDNFPVYQVTYTEAIEFTRKFTEQEHEAGRLPTNWEYRLPTEAQWEYACRSGTTTATAFGDTLGGADANCDGTKPYNGAPKGPYLGKVCEVGNYRLNAWGLKDMHGNVWEWCLDWYQEKLVGGDDPEGPRSVPIRVIRGGSWFSSAEFCRAAYRSRYEPTSTYGSIGLRVARVPSVR